MISMVVINQKVCEYFDIDLSHPFKDNRKIEVVYTRQLFHYLARTLNKSQLSFAKIGRYREDIKTYNHATVMNSCKTIRGYIDVDPHVKNQVETIIKMISENE